MNDFPLQPVFLIGAGRSGTKFLRNILGVSNDIAIVPYDVGYVWRYTNESVPHDEFSEDMATAKVIKYVRKQLPKLIDKKGKPDAKYFIEKSVPNSLRPGFIYKIYPKAKFIHLIRDGRSVTESSMRLWQATPKKGYLLNKLKYFPLSNYRYAFWYISNYIRGILFLGRGQGIWGPRYKGMDDDAKSLSLETICSRQWKHCLENSLNQLNEIPPNQVMELKYEDLMVDEKKVEEICLFLGIHDPEVVLQSFRDNVVKSNMDKWKTQLSDSSLHEILIEIGPLLKKLRYMN